MTTWHTEWQSQNQLLSVESTTVGNAYKMHRIVQGPEIGAGAVALAIRSGQSPEILFVRQIRIIPGVTLWELPRGMAEPTDVDLVATARREFTEETGIATTGGRQLGVIYPDSGLLGSKVGVVMVEASEEPGSERDGEVEEVAWLPIADVHSRIAAGEIADGISLAALSLAAALGEV